MTSGTLAQTKHDLRSTSCAASLCTLKTSDGTGKNWCTGRGPRFGSWSCQNALPAWVGIPAKLVTPEMNAHDVHDASEIVGENVQRISVATFGRRFNQEVRCPHPHLQRGEGMLDRLATRSAARKASMRFGRPSAETELKYPMSVPYHAHVEIRTLSMLSVSI